MRTFKAYIAGFALLIGLVPFYVHAQTTSTQPLEHLFYLLDTKASTASFRAHASQINIVSPKAYYVTSELKTLGTVSDEVLSIARAHQIKVMPHITNESFSSSTIHNLLSNPSAQDTLISFLITESKEKGYYGIQYDFEHILSQDRDLYTAFVAKSAQAFHNANLKLTLAAVARVSDVEDSFYKNWGGAFDYEKLAAHVDFISLMTYDDPNSVGPSASLPYLKSVYAFIQDKIPSDKLSLGMPLYYWGWNSTKGTKVRVGGTYDRITRVRSLHNVTEGYSKLLEAPYLSYKLYGWKFTIWYENQKSIQAKTSFIKSTGARGFSAWVLGVENPEIWNAL